MFFGEGIDAVTAIAADILSLLVHQRLVEDKQVTLRWAGRTNVNRGLDAAGAVGIGDQGECLWFMGVRNDGHADQHQA
ncbi:hypothetical protein D3C73_1520700 [compost metagenome]